jgi:hypothetical protein
MHRIVFSIAFFRQKLPAGGMERRLGNDHAMMHKSVTLIGLRKRLLIAALTAFAATAPASAQNYGQPTIPYGNTSSFYFDGRDDDRDSPTDGVFPGNFAADPVYATIGGASGFLGSNPRRSAAPYPSQTYIVTVHRFREQRSLKPRTGRLD